MTIDQQQHYLDRIRAECPTVTATPWHNGARLGIRAVSHSPANYNGSPTTYGYTREMFDVPTIEKFIALYSAPVKG